MSDLRRLVAIRLKDARVKSKLSQAGLAQRAGLSVSYIGMVERAERLPQLEALEQLAKAMKLPLPYFLTDDHVANVTLRTARFIPLLNTIEGLGLKFEQIDMLTKLAKEMWGQAGKGGRS